MKSAENMWMHYIKNIIAADLPSAVFLASYLRHIGNSNNYVFALEVIDIQKYNVIRESARVSTALQKRVGLPFVFVVGKN